MADRFHLTGIHFGFASVHFRIIRPKRRTVQTVEKIGNQPFTLLAGKFISLTLDFR